MEIDDPLKLHTILPYHSAIKMGAKYKQLGKIFTKELVLEIVKSGNEINVLIDIEPILRCIATDRYWAEEINIPIDNKETIIIYSIIKVIGHYKHYFRKLHIKATIITFYGLKKPSMLDFTKDQIGNHRISEYIKDSPFGLKTKKLVEKSLALYSKICSYTNNVHNINTGELYRPTMCHMVLNALDKTSTKTNVIITSDKLLFAFGLPDYQSYHKTIVFNGRNPIPITKEDYYTTMHGVSAGKMLSTIPGSYLYHRYIDSLLGENKQNIKRITRFTKKNLVVLKSIIEDSSVDDIEDKFIALMAPEKERLYRANLRIYNPILMSSLATEESREYIRRQTINYTNPDIHDQLIEMLYRLDPVGVQFGVTTFIR